MNKKAKTKAQKADEDANLDEALAETFPASDPSALDDPAPDRGGRAAEKAEETPEARSDPPRDKAEPRESNETVAFTAW